MLEMFVQESSDFSSFVQLNSFFLL